VALYCLLGLCHHLYIIVLDRKYVMLVYQSYTTGEGSESHQNVSSNELMQELEDDFAISL
jgi:hypothetical protein